jgi:hypothetical protein
VREPRGRWRMGLMLACNASRRSPPCSTSLCLALYLALYLALPRSTSLHLAHRSTSAGKDHQGQPGTTRAEER